MISASSGLQLMRSWRVFPWPAWVPASVRVQVEHIWPAGPTEWLRNTDAVSAPLLGETVKVLAGNALITGRYVHLRNVTGRIIDNTGQVHVVELGRPWPKARRAS